MTLRSIDCYDVSSLGHVGLPVSHLHLNAVTNIGTILTSLDEVLALCESSLLPLIHESVWDEPWTNSGQIFLFLKSSRFSVVVEALFY
jgi:hypothetical protein